MAAKKKKLFLPKGNPPSYEHALKLAARRKNPPQLLKMSFPPSALRKLPPEHLDLLIIFSVALNELNAILKINLLLGLQNYPDNTQETYAQCHRMAFVKIYAGKLYEVWEVIRSRYFGSSLSRELDPVLSQAVLNHLYFLKRYFSKKNNVVHRIRNDAAFHFPRKKLDYTAKYLKSRRWSSVFYDMHHNFNNLYVAGEFMAMLHYLNELEAYNAETHLEIDAEVGEVAASVYGFAGGVLNHLLSRLIEISGSRSKLEIVTITHKIKTESVSIPVILDIRKALKRDSDVIKRLDRMNAKKFRHMRAPSAKKPNISPWVF